MKYNTHSTNWMQKRDSAIIDRNHLIEIGFDHYRFDIPLEIDKFPNEFRPEIRNGYNEAKIREVRIKHPDMYEKKLLTIRDRALNKGLKVSITAMDLKEKLEETKGYCPITDRKLTFAENPDTDWSIDRIDNNRGYCPDNIVIVSTIVNMAKNDMDLSDIIKKALGKTSSDDSLSAKEWYHLVRFYYPRMKLQKPLCTSMLLADSPQLFDQIIFLQLFKHQERYARAFLKQLEKFIGKEIIVKAAKLTSKRVYHRAEVDVEVLYDSPKLYKWVQAFITTINAHRSEFDNLLLDCIFA